MIPRPLSKLSEKTHIDQTLRSTLNRLRLDNQTSTHHPFDEIPQPNLPQCNHLLLEYSRKNLNREALDLFIETHRSSNPINDFTLSCILKVSGSIRDQFLGRQFHSVGIKFGFDDAVSVGTSLVDMYMKCDMLEDGRRVFDLMKDKNVVSWTSLLTGYLNKGVINSVFELFLKMQYEGIKPNSFTFASFLSSCAMQREIKIGTKAHSLLIKLGFETTTFVCNSLINMYSKCGMIQESRLVFEEMENFRDVVSWNAMISGLVLNGFDLEALKFLYSMRVDGHRFSQLSFVTAIKLCANLKALTLARQLHCCVFTEGYGQDCNILTALLVVYCKCDEISDAFELFSIVSEDRSVVSWTAMIGGFIQNNESHRAVKLFNEMMRNGIEPNDFTYSTVLTASPACISPFEIHCQAIKTNYLCSLSVGSALLAAYSKLGNTYEAISIFKRIDEKDIVTWSAMLSTYAQAADSEGAIELFREMVRKGVFPNEFTFSSVINACSSPTSSSDQGKQFHAFSIKYRYQDTLCVSSALVTMYSKKGSIESAQRAFERQPERDLVSWNSMVSGYAQHGYGKRALQIFQEMVEQGLVLDSVTFLGVLVACTHTGLIDEGRKYFDSMIKDHEIVPTMGHYACMVDLYSRAGRLKEAMELITDMPFQAGPTVWRTLLAACRVHKNIELGELAAKTLIQMEPNDSAAYVLLSNVYATAGRWEDRDAVRKLMDDRKVKKEAGISWIQIKNKTHSFLASDKSHPLSDRIQIKIEEIMSKLKQRGYRPNTEFVLRDMEEEQKAATLAQHSERLAIAYGLISTLKGSPLQIVKNLRVCGDCHTVIKMVSAMEDREIVVRDSNRFHHFKDGSCSCADYW
ncbi:pentatricopeptide repeat-containing protein At2g27610 [Asparagus officinalis]|uniref:pentatricopeptide repeat-containing protein At2g27610 n=1 Tax=Asparagus officinalis TaxID=4686 RepID=UPI00098E80A7|nr:pentatricopeptide repeat-containing protein At2g27610 [Asparagus officinalis]